MSRKRPTPPTKDRPFKTDNGFTVDTNKSNGDNSKNKKLTP